jgi:hypothetical protein
MIILVEQESFMVIAIKGDVYAQSIFNQNQAKWNNHFKKIKLFLLLMGSVAILFVFAGVLTWNDPITINKGLSKHYNYTYFFFSFGISLLILLMLVLRIQLNSKKQLQDNVLQVCERLKGENEVKIEINVNDLIFDTKQTYNRYSWEYFTFKKEMGTFLVLMVYKSDFDSIAIDYSLLDIHQKDELALVLKSKHWIKSL